MKPSLRPWFERLPGWAVADLIAVIVVVLLLGVLVWWLVCRNPPR